MKVQLVMFFCILQLISGDTRARIPIGFPPLSPFIVGGTNASDGQAPFQCSLQQNKRHFCGCAILSSKWIVSAAHCLQSPASSIEIMVGTNDLKSGGTYYKAADLITHEGYDLPPFANDIGVVRVQGEIEFSRKVQPIKFTSKKVDGGVALQATGWGRLSAGGQVPQFLQVIKLNSITNAECNAIHGNTVHDSHLCTYTKVGEGVCSGDSGGPLVLGDELVGLANWAVLCARGYPDGFARISYLHDWIKVNTDLD